jgi:hypothetical protein
LRVSTTCRSPNPIARCVGIARVRVPRIIRSFQILVFESRVLAGPPAKSKTPCTGERVIRRGLVCCLYRTDAFPGSPDDLIELACFPQPASSGAVLPLLSHGRPLFSSLSQTCVTPGALCRVRRNPRTSATYCGGHWPSHAAINCRAESWPGSGIVCARAIVQGQS